MYLHHSTNAEGMHYSSWEVSRESQSSPLRFFVESNATDHQEVSSFFQRKKSVLSELRTHDLEPRIVSPDHPATVTYLFYWGEPKRAPHLRVRHLPAYASGVDIYKRQRAETFDGKWHALLGTSPSTSDALGTHEVWQREVQMYIL